MFGAFGVVRVKSRFLLEKITVTRQDEKMKTDNKQMNGTAHVHVKEKINHAPNGTRHQDQQYGATTEPSKNGQE